MGDAKHTPGPWKVGTNHSAAVWATAGLIASVYPGEPATSADDCDGPVSDANARLIAAAPDLLAACIAFRDAQGLTSLGEAHTKAREAISKATGAA